VILSDLASMTDDKSSPPTIAFPAYAFPPFQMPTSKLAIQKRNAYLRAQMSRELTLATLKEPNSWDPCWRALLLVQVILKQYAFIDSLHDHQFVYERWWMQDANGLNLKILLTNEAGTSMVLLGTSVWDSDDYLSTRWVCLHPWL